MNARFYVPGAQTAGELVALPHDEAQHLTRVLRLKAGAAIRAFNGRGAEFDALVERVTKGDVVVRVGESRLPATEPRVAVTLAQAVLKGDKMDDVVRDAVMMGVAQILPVVSVRSEVTLAAVERGRRPERWERIAVSSAKQCGRATVPRILEPASLAEVLKDVAEGRRPSPALMLVEPGACGASISIHDVGTTEPTEALILVGPEGGWASEEIDAAVRACQLITLGGRTLRADAASVVSLAALFALWKEF